MARRQGTGGEGGREGKTVDYRGKWDSISCIQGIGAGKEGPNENLQKDIHFPVSIVTNIIFLLTKHLMLLVALFQAVLRLSEVIWPWTTYVTV